MTLNLVGATPDFIFCVADRRLTNKAIGTITERSSKVTAFDLENGVRGLITYNGVGRTVEGVTPCDWLAELPLSRSMSLHDFTDLVAKECGEKVRDAAPQFEGNPRHSFILAAYNNGEPILGVISNYEPFGEPGKQLADRELKVELKNWPKLPRRGIVAAGATHLLRRSDRSRLEMVINSANKPEPIISAARKTVRDVAHRRGRAGTVGTSISGAYMLPNGNVQMIYSVVGKTTVIEGIAMISPSQKILNPSISLGGPTLRQAAMQRGEDVTGWPDIAELPCPKCRNPNPEGYSKCGRCGEELGRP